MISITPRNWGKTWCQCIRDKIGHSGFLEKKTHWLNATRPQSHTNDLSEGRSTSHGLRKTFQVHLLQAHSLAETNYHVSVQMEWGLSYWPPTEEYWLSVYRSPYQAARETKVQAFHFRLVHRFIPCNHFLKNIRIKRDDKCSFCPAPDTIQHFLYMCPTVNLFWKQVVSWFSRESDIQLKVSLRSFLFIVPNATPKAKIIILLFTKFFIYRQKLFHFASLGLAHFLRGLSQWLQVEKYITSQQIKSFLFARWQQIFTALG